MSPTTPPVTGPSRDALRLRTLTACLVASGAAALVYEVLWLREFSLVMGHTVYALATVLSTFLGGLALGAWLSGKFTARRPVTLKHYAFLELGIGLSALALPLAVKALDPAYGSAYRALSSNLFLLSVVQLLISGLVVIVPTLLMGATLPLVTALILDSRRDMAVGAGRLYAANSIGGALGAVLAGFLLLPHLGMGGTLAVAVTLNLGVAVALAWLRQRTGDEPTVAPDAAASRSLPGAAENHDWPSPSLALLLPAYALSGFAALALEVGWSRLVSLSIGSTTYGFTIILFTYIGGLSAGSWIVPRLAYAKANPVRMACILQVVIAACSLLTLAHLGSLPIRIVELMGSSATSFGNLIAWETVAVATTIFLPTFAMGGLFPLVTQLVHAQLAATGKALGSTYAVNTAGNILGSLVAGFVLVPWIGMRGTIMVSAVLSGLVALAYILPAIARKRRGAYMRVGFVTATVAVCLLLAPSWDQELITSAPYLYGRNLARRSGGQRAAIRATILDRFDLVDYKEGATTVVTVKRERASNVLHLQVGGKSDAYSFASTQNLIAHLPLALNGQAKRVLVVGLGSGGTLGSVLSHDVESADCVEISAEVRDAARTYFSEFTNGAVDDPRAHVTIADGRNHLRHAGKSYDVIISQPSNPWMSGAASLFTVEYFRDVRDHLEPGGVACSWFKSLADDGDSLGSVLRSWTEVFENAALLETRVLGEYVLIGFRDPGQPSLAKIAASLSQPRAAADARRVGLTEPVDVLSHVLLDSAGVKAYSASARLNTDANGYIEFNGATTLFRPDGKLGVLRELFKHRVDLTQVASFEGVSEPERTRWAAQLADVERTKELVLQGRILEEGGGRGGPEWTALARQVRALDPREPYFGSLPNVPASTAASTTATDEE